MERHGQEGAVGSRRLGDATDKFEVGGRRFRKALKSADNFVCDAQALPRNQTVAYCPRQRPAHWKQRIARRFWHLTLQTDHLGGKQWSLSTDVRH